MTPTAEEFLEAAPSAESFLDDAPSAEGFLDEARPGELAGTANEFQRGLLAGQQQLVAAQLADAPKAPSMRQLRKGYVQAMSNPRYQTALMEAGADPVQQERVENAFGPTAQVSKITTAIAANRQFLGEQVAQLEAEQRAIPMSEAMEQWSKADNSNWHKVLAHNPVEIAAGIVAQSLPTMAPALLGTVVAPGGRAGRAMAAGTGSLAAESANAYLDAARLAGYDFTDADQVQQFFANPQAKAQARAYALKRGVPIAVFDSVTAGLAGKFLAPALREGVKRTAVATGKEIALQAAGGALGETAAQVTTGQKLSLKDIAAEAIGEVAGSGPIEAYTNIRDARRSAQSGPAARQSGRPENDELPPALPMPMAIEPAGRILTRAIHESPAEFEKRTEHFRRTGEVLPPPAPQPDVVNDDAKKGGTHVTQTIQTTPAAPVSILKTAGAAEPEHVAPEAGQTIELQMRMLEAGKRSAVLITPGEQMPDMSQVSDRFRVLDVPGYGTMIYNVRSHKPERILELAKQDKLGRILGYGVDRKPAPGTEVGVVTVRNPQGVEKQAVVTDQPNLPNVIKAAEKVADKQDTIQLETPQQVLEQRQASTADQITAAFKGLASGAGSAFREKMVADVKAGKEVTFHKPHSINLLRKDPTLVLRDNPDGSVTILAIKEPGNSQPAAPAADPYASMWPTKRLDSGELQLGDKVANKGNFGTIRGTVARNDKGRVGVQSDDGKSFFPLHDRWLPNDQVPEPAALGVAGIKRETVETLNEVLGGKAGFIPEGLVTRALATINQLNASIAERNLDPEEWRSNQTKEKNLAAEIRGTLHRLANAQEAIDKKYKRAQPERVKQATAEIEQLITQAEAFLAREQAAVSAEEFLEAEPTIVPAHEKATLPNGQQIIPRGYAHDKRRKDGSEPWQVSFISPKGVETVKSYKNQQDAEQKLNIKVSWERFEKLEQPRQTLEDLKRQHQEADREVGKLSTYISSSGFARLTPEEQAEQRAELERLKAERTKVEDVILAEFPDEAGKIFTRPAEPPAAVEETDPTFTAEFWAEDLDARGIHHTPELTHLMARHHKLNRETIDARIEHQDTSKQDRELERMRREEHQLAEKLNPPLYHEGDRAQWRAGKTDAPKAVRITGSRFDVTNGRTYQFKIIGEPNVHVAGFNNADHFQPMEESFFAGEVARAEQEMRQTRGEFQAMGKWADLKSQRARGEWQRAKAAAAVAEMRFTNLRKELEQTTAAETKAAAGKVTARHLAEARQALEIERPPDVRDDIEGQTRGPVRFPEADFRNMVDKVREELALEKYKKPYARLRKEQRTTVDRIHKMSVTEGMDADQVLLGLARENQKYADWSIDDLAEALTRPAVQMEDTAAVKALAKEIAEAEAGSYPEAGGSVQTLLETATAGRLDALSRDVHGKPYADLQTWQQDAIRQAVESDTRPRQLSGKISATLQPGYEPVRPATPAQPAAKGASRKLSPARAGASVGQRAAELTPSAQRLLALRYLERHIPYLQHELLNIAPDKEDTRVDARGQMTTTTTTTTPDARLLADLQLQLANAKADQQTIYQTQLAYVQRLQENPRWMELQRQLERSGQGRLPGDEQSAIEAAAEEATPAVDRLEQWLTAAIRATDLNRGRALEGITGAPVWLTKSFLNGLLRIIRAAYRGTRNLPQAIQTGIDWLRAQNVPNFSETELKAWLQRNLSTTPEDDDINVREFQDQLDSAEPIGTDIGRQVGNLLYERRTNESDAAMAARIIAAVGGPAQAIDVFTDATNGLPGSVRMLLGQLIIKALGVAGQHEAAARFYDETFAAHVTQTAQALQSLSAFLALTPQGKLIWARRKIERAAEDLVAPHRPQIEEAKRQVEAVNRAGIEEATASHDVQVAARNAIDAAIQQQAATPGTPLAEAIRKEVLEALVAAGLITAREAQIAALHYEGTAANSTLADKLRTAGVPLHDKRAAAINELYRSKTKAEREKIKTRARKARADQSPEAQQAAIDRAIKRAMKELRVMLGQLIREHHTKAEGVGKSLAEKIAAASGLPEAEARKLAEAVEKRFAEIVTKRKKDALEKLLKPLQQAGLAKRGLVEKVIALSNLGAMSDEQLWNAIRTNLDLPAWSNELAERIRKQVDAIERIGPDELERKQKAQIELLNTIERAKGVDAYDLAIAFYVTNILTGFTTHAKNMLSTSLNVSASLGSELARTIAAGNFSDVPAVIEALGQGMKRGALAAGDVLRTGMVTGSRLTKIEPGRALELTRFGHRGGVPSKGLTKAVLETWPARVLNLWKYNFRAMAAEDLLFFKPAEEAKAAILAKRQARTEGLKGEAARDRARQLLGYGRRALDAAAAQAASEGLTGAAAQRRTAELLHSARPEQLREDARQFALRTTFNADPYGALGFLAHMINQAKGAQNRKIRLGANLIAPFTNIIANVVNESLNYTPVGALRARWSGNELLGYEKKNLTPDQLKDLQAELYAKAMLGTALMTAVMLKAAGEVDEPDPDFAVYGAGPASDTDRKGLEAKKWIPHSIKIGERYYSYANTPLAIPMAWLGNWSDRIRDSRVFKSRSAQRTEQSLPLMAATSAVGMAKVITEQSFMTGIMDLFKTLNQPAPAAGGRRLLKLATRTGTSMVVPNLVRQIDQTFNPSTFSPQDATAMLVNSTPFIRAQGRPALNALGLPVTRSLSQQFTSSQAGADPLVKLIAETGNWPALPDRNEIFPRAGRTMTSDEYYTYVRESSANAYRQLEKLRADGRLAKFKDNVRSKYISDYISASRAQWRAANGF